MLGRQNRLTNYKNVNIEVLSDEEIQQRIRAASQKYGRRGYSHVEVGDVVFVKNHKPSLFHPLFEEEMNIVGTHATHVEVEYSWGRTWKGR